ncbi:MAG TPA: hypothetical protein ENL01_04005 [Chlorobaculum parvum]|uniref:Uncharacterized protein n=1 Tax=Chlorobaculum parvum TaxID=274539 RepID=A0A7C5H742_9CHLB|nr:hypothetical protein [Chlorobaculum parvum]
MDTVPKALVQDSSSELAGRRLVSSLSFPDIPPHEKSFLAVPQDTCCSCRSLNHNRKGNYVTFKVFLYLGISFRRSSGQGSRPDLRCHAG